MNDQNIQRFNAAGFYEQSEKLYSLGLAFTKAPTFMDEAEWKAIEVSTVKDIENPTPQMHFGAVQSLQPEELVHG